MIYHNAKNGLSSAILNEVYKPDTTRIYSAPDGTARRQRIAPDVMVSHDMFGSTLTLRLEDEIYIIHIEKIISDIMEVEHENENLYSDH